VTSAERNKLQKVAGIWLRIGSVAAEISAARFAARRHEFLAAFQPLR